jgi:NAD(P)-dependent dehydrogenase (short-subunit alcohol dehydrogenase family)
MRLENKVAIVTGAGQGIGRAILERFVGEGARVVAIELSDASAGRAIAGLPLERIEMLCLDTHQQSTVDEAIRVAKARFGGLDVLVNNAVQYTAASLTNETDEGWARTIDSALGATFRFCRAAMPEMIARGGGSIVNLASINQIVANPGLAAYTAAKGGVRALTKQIAVEFGVQCVRCNSISPAFIATERTVQGLTPADLAAVAQSYPLGRIGEPSDVANAALFLASDESSFITGVDLPLDGGLTSLAASALLSNHIRTSWGLPALHIAENKK